MKEMSKTTGEKFTKIYDNDVWSTMDKARGLKGIEKFKNYHISS